jgi:hypothetical protein
MTVDFLPFYAVEQKAKKLNILLLARERGSPKTRKAPTEQQGLR